MVAVMLRCAGIELMGVLAAGMTADHVLERLTDGAAVITPGDRSDVVLAVASAGRRSFPSCHRPQWRVQFAHPAIAAWFPACDCGYLSSPRVGTLRHRQRCRVGPRAGDGDVATQDRHRVGADDGPPRGRRRSGWRS